MFVLKLENKRSSINHAELSGHTEDGKCFYLRFRAGVLDIRTAEKFDDKDRRYISERNIETQYKERYETKHYQDMTREFENWNDMLEDTPYVFDEPVNF